MIAVKSMLGQADRALFELSKLREDRSAEIEIPPFAQFVEDAWPVIEPGRPFVPGWHLSAICEHLTAVSEGQIKRLLVNMPPRHGKSSLITVLWSVWLLLNNPATRLLCSSYALNLATRDNVKARRIIQSAWFQQRYGGVFSLVKDQNAKFKFETDRLGYRMVTSVGSGTTGEGGDVLICLCYNTEVTTDIGRLCIGDIVEQKLPVRVLAFDHGSNSARWQKIDKYEASPGRPCVRVTLNDGRVIDATTDHPFYVVGRGYIPAAQLTNTDEVITDESFLSRLRERVQSSTVCNCKCQALLLQQGMQEKLAIKAGELLHVRGMWEGIQASPQACSTQYKRHLLQSRMSWKMADRREQPCLSRWQDRAYLRSMRKEISCQAYRFTAARREVLFKAVQWSSKQGGKSPSLPGYTGYMRILPESDIHQAKSSWDSQLLQQGMLQQSTQRTYHRGEQRALYRWWGYRSLFLRISQTSTDDSGSRWEQVSPLSADSRREWQRIRRSSHQLRQGSQRTFKSSLPLPMVPREDARIGRAEKPVETLLVRCVEPIPTPERVYNIRVTEDHNYFGQGILVHNCDDPHNIDEKESEAKREAALIWFNDTWSSRLNDFQETTMVVVAHRIHMQDVSGHILETNDGEWTHLYLPAEYHPGSKCVTPVVSSSNDSYAWKGEDPRKEEGELLWPKRFPQKAIDKAKKRHGVLGYSALYDQNPIPPGGFIFNASNERLFTISPQGDMYHLITPSGVQPVLIENCWELSTSDVAAKDKEVNDFTVFCHWAVTPGNDVLLLDLWRGHWSIPKQKEKARLFYRTHFSHRYRAFYWEDVAYQSAISQDLALEGIPCMEFPIRNKGDKVARAVGASIWQEAGKSYFRQGASWLEDFRGEIYKFPKGAHDDQVDPYSMVCMIVRSGGVADDDAINAMIRYAG